jgi:hypothetical protein
LKSWWEKHLTEESRDLIKHFVKKDEEGNPIFNERIGMGIPDGVNSLVFTIIRHFIGTASNITSRIHDQLSNLKCPTMSNFRWYEDVFTSRVMLEKIVINHTGKKNSLMVYLIFLLIKFELC